MSARLNTPVSKVDDDEPLAGNYFVAVYPPFSAWQPLGRSEIEKEIGAACREIPPSEAAAWGLYIHIPYCERRCNYCYYLSFPRARREELARYADHLAREASLYAALPRFANHPPRFVYFGGGTPSLLGAEELTTLLDELRARLSWGEVEEITFECSPKSINRQKLGILHAAGVNRISLGVQQLDDEVLRLSGRIHLVADVERAAAEIRAFDFAEVNMDLIAGLPGQTDASFTSGLERTIALAPDCVTIYQLEVPGNTPLYRSLGDQEVSAALADWETKRQRVAGAFRMLEQHGYRIRNAYSAVRGERHRRFTYTEEQYRGADLIGLGLSSFSYIDGVHFQNTTSLNDYFEAISQSRLPVVRGCRLSREEQMVREFVLQLKLGSASRRYFEGKFGIDPVTRFSDALCELASSGWLTWNDAEIRLTTSGLVRVDRLLPAFYLKQHRTCSYW
jgi:oxygen-independent coproporphyrinogen-3 oxidase